MKILKNYVKIDLVKNMSFCELAFDAGLGDRNSQGYGMMEMVLNQRRNS